MNTLILLLAAVLSQDGPKPKDPKKEKPVPIPNDALVALRKELEPANQAEALEILARFADAHRPKTGAREGLSKDGTIQVLLGASGTPEKPDAPDVELKPKGTQYSIAVAGHGGNPSDADGGKGGSVWLRASPQGQVILVGGNGGTGADGSRNIPGKKGGAGGNIWFAKFNTNKVWLIRGNGGKGGMGNPGGDGGPGGSYGPEPPKQ